MLQSSEYHSGRIRYAHSTFVLLLFWRLERRGEAEEWNEEYLVLSSKPRLAAVVQHARTNYVKFDLRFTDDWNDEAKPRSGMRNTAPY